ncbi:MAG: imidazoleglycerol-phosphate dehydratase HisB [Lachnospiraceae bacterium]|nr:imidazoleglycerol-phosphate dehydratase HisB [Lachnospiraceae bacterium]MBO5324945.1 imidazoleglycerol-phosphate dehydratase HisB [Lachnospiraceae bacterium]MBQ3035495.1 imidazoleglycerol-phosphate dehydratase HisB [Lachnospiraceae bacterium]
MSRKAELKRKTSETDISVSLELDGKGKYEVKTGIGFFDHMLEGFTKHGSFDLKLTANGDLNVDNHHTVEDVGIVLGSAIRQALGDKEGINRYASFIQPMDDALVLVAVDLCNRPYLNFKYNFNVERVGYFETETLNEFFYALSYAAGMNIHIKVLDGENAHHIIEAMFKGFANALKIACAKDGDRKGVLSTKGQI